MHTSLLYWQQHQLGHTLFNPQRPIPHDLLNTQYQLYSLQKQALQHTLSTWTASDIHSAQAHDTSTAYHCQILGKLFQHFFEQLEQLHYRIQEQSHIQFTQFSTKDWHDFNCIHKLLEPYGVNLYCELTPINLLMNYNIHTLHTTYHQKLSTLDLGHILKSHAITHSPIVTFWQIVCFELKTMLEKFEPLRTRLPLSIDTSACSIPDSGFALTCKTFHNSLQQDIGAYCHIYLMEQIQALCTETTFERPLMLIGLTIQQIKTSHIFVDFNHLAQHCIPLSHTPTSRQEKSYHTKVQRFFSLLPTIVPIIRQDVHALGLPHPPLALDIVGLTAPHKTTKTIQQIVEQHIQQSLTHDDCDPVNLYLLAQAFLSHPLPNHPQTRLCEKNITQIQVYAEKKLNEDNAFSSIWARTSRCHLTLESPLFQHRGTPTRHGLFGNASPKTKIIQKLKQSQAHLTEEVRPLSYKLTTLLAISIAVITLCVGINALYHYGQHHSLIKMLIQQLTPPIHIAHWYSPKLWLWAMKIVLCLSFLGTGLYFIVYGIRTIIKCLRSLSHDALTSNISNQMKNHILRTQPTPVNQIHPHADTPPPITPCQQRSMPR